MDETIWVFLFQKIWQISKHFPGAFCRVQTLQLLGVYTIVYLSHLLLEHGKICKVKVEALSFSPT